MCRVCKNSCGSVPITITSPAAVLGEVIQSERGGAAPEYVSDGRRVCVGKRAPQSRYCASENSAAQPGRGVYVRKEGETDVPARDEKRVHRKQSAAARPLRRRYGSDGRGSSERGGRRRLAGAPACRTAVTEITLELRRDGT